MERRPNTNNKSHISFFDRAVHLWWLGSFYVLVIIVFKENKPWYFVSGYLDSATQHYSGTLVTQAPGAALNMKKGTDHFTDSRSSETSQSNTWIVAAWPVSPLPSRLQGRHWEAITRLWTCSWDLLANCPLTVWPSSWVPERLGLIYKEK